MLSKTKESASLKMLICRLKNEILNARYFYIFKVLLQILLALL